MARSQKQPTNEKGALEKIKLRELYKWFVKDVIQTEKKGDKLFFLFGGEKNEI